MYTDLRRLQDPVKQWFERWEADHGIPVRILNGGWRIGGVWANNNWTDRQVRGTEFTRQQASAQGLTIIAMGSAVPNAWLDYGARWPRPPATDDTGTFQDLITAYPQGVADPGYPDRIYDFGDYDPIVWTQPNGVDRAYGEVGDRIVTFYWNLETVYAEYWDLDALFARIEDAVDAEAAERRRQQMIAQSFDNFMTFMSEGRINRQIDQLRTQIRTEESNIITWQISLADTLSRVNGLRTQIEAMMAQAEFGEAEWRQQYEAIANNPAVESVLFRNNSLRITTHPITLRGQRQWEGETRWLGRFQIDVNLNNHSTRIVNLDNPQGGRDHPHVPDGQPCFGGQSSEFTTLLGNGMFGVYIELIIQWLENYNPRDDWGQYAANWFNLPDADPRFQEQDGDTETVEEAEQAVPVATVSYYDELDEDIFDDDEV